MDTFQLNFLKAMQTLLAQSGLNPTQQYPFNQLIQQGQASNQLQPVPFNQLVQQGQASNQLQQIPFNQIVQQGQALNRIQQVGLPFNQLIQQGQALNQIQQVPFNQLVQQGQPLNLVQQEPFNRLIQQGQALIQFQQEPFIQHIIQPDKDLLATKQDLVIAEPTDLLQALSLLNPNFEFFKQQLSSSKFKKQLTTTLLEDMNILAAGLNEMEINFDVNQLMICAMFGYTAKGLKLILEGANVNIQNNQGLTALMYASMFQCEDFVVMLIEKGADINLKDGRQMDALMWAVLQDNIEITKMLLTNKADVNTKTPSGLNALHIAVEKGLDKIVELLLAKNVDVDSKSLDGWTPLMRSVRLQGSTITKLLIEKNANVNERNYEGNTALHISAMYLNETLASRLLKHEADVNITNNMGMTPLMYAVNMDSLKIVQQLIEKGAKETINVVNKFKRTALFYAVVGNRKDIIEKLIQSEADTNTNDLFGLSPLAYACKNQRQDIVKQLVRFKDDAWYKGSEFMICLITVVTNNDFKTAKCLLKVKQKSNFLSEIVLAYRGRVVCPLHTAVRNRNIAMLELLLNAGADVNSTNIHLQTVLMINIILNETKTAKLLVETYNADVNLKDYKGDTALILAAETNNKIMVDFLLKKNASKEVTNDQGISAIMLASSLGNCDMVRSLYGESYNLELCDSEGWTPLMFSTFSGDIQTVKFLLDNRANINVFSKDQATPLIIVSANGKTEVVALLLERGASVNERDRIGQTALIHAARNGHTHILETLLMNKVTNCSLGDIFKKTALIYTVIRGDLESTKLLLQHNANCSQGDINGTTPLMISAFHGFTECMKTLLDFKVQVNESNIDGNTALHFSSANGHNSTVSVLLQHNADPNKTNVNGNTPLMLAAAKGYDSVVQSLLSSPAVDVNLYNSVDKRSALIFAVLFNKLTIVKLLVQAEADVNASTKTGETALHLCIIHGFVDIANYLVTVSNINLNAETDIGITPLLFSIQFERFDLIKSLIEAGAEVKKVKVDAISYSIQRKSVSSLKIILEKCPLSRKEKGMYQEIAKICGCTAEISELIQQAKECEEVKNTETQNETVESCMETECKPHETFCSPPLDNFTDLPDTIIEQTNLHIDNSSARNFNIYLNGDNHNITINSNIPGNTNINVDTIKNCTIGDNNNVLNDQSGQI